MATKRAKTFSGSLLLLLVLLSLVSCLGIPSDFDSLSLSEKIRAYDKHRLHGGASIGYALGSISSHGTAAALEMVPYLSGNQSGIDFRDALTIIYEVQTHGCSLKGTAVEQAVRRIVESEKVPPVDPYREDAKRTLDAIVPDKKFPDSLDALPPEVCDAVSVDSRDESNLAAK